jgi:hypothetical protein
MVGNAHADLLLLSQLVPLAIRHVIGARDQRLGTKDPSSVMGNRYGGAGAFGSNSLGSVAQAMHCGVCPGGVLRGDATMSLRAALTVAERRANLVQRP